ncbi:RIPENING-RELATED PROTEIN 2-RELATED [Salix viminalis]|uniref:RIPENING-RELATED PROTEIN 2-RELATED n=1 Tax=Salix viminalis TaxID=40686 RepID=A0A9Q0NLX8_SALVM|nr:RIPENING-RELATED PROTEIN 2-RELATED [Salix viminalis]
MKKSLLVHLSLLSSIFFYFTLLIPSNAVSSCDGPCQTLDDCDGQLICINGKCSDDPDGGAHTCSGGSSPSPPMDGCRSSGTLTCNGNAYPTYTCSPPESSSTGAKLTLNNFSEGGDGGAPSECDESYHAKTELVVALSTGWYAGGSKCGQMIRITAATGSSVTAKVVDECDSEHGCDGEHAYQPPCENNVVDGSDAVWEALGLDKDKGVESVKWSMA